MCYVSLEDGPGYLTLWVPTHGTPSINHGYLVVFPFLGTQHTVPGTSHTLASSGPFEINKKPGPTQAGPRSKGQLRGHHLGLKGGWRRAPRLPSLAQTYCVTMGKFHPFLHLAFQWGYPSHCPSCGCYLKKCGVRCIKRHEMTPAVTWIVILETPKCSSIEGWLK